MKKIKNLALVFVMLLIACIPILVVGCGEPESKENLELSSTFKTSYVIGDSLDVEGGVIDYTDKLGTTTQVDVNSTMVSGFSSEHVGKRTMVLTYKGLSLNVEYTVTTEIVTNVLLYNSNGLLMNGYYDYIYITPTKIYVVALNMEPQNALSYVLDSQSFTYKRKVNNNYLQTCVVTGDAITLTFNENHTISYTFFDGEKTFSSTLRMYLN